MFKITFFDSICGSVIQTQGSLVIGPPEKLRTQRL